MIGKQQPAHCRRHECRRRDKQRTAFTIDTAPLFVPFHVFQREQQHEGACSVHQQQHQQCQMVEHKEAVLTDAAARNRKPNQHACLNHQQTANPSVFPGPAQISQPGQYSQVSHDGQRQAQVGKAGRH